jgi:hypothetical protein
MFALPFYSTHGWSAWAFKKATAPFLVKANDSVECHDNEHDHSYGYGCKYWRGLDDNRIVDSDDHRSCRARSHSHFRGGLLASFFIKPKPNITWRKEVVDLTLFDADSMGHRGYGEGKQEFFKACVVYFEVENRGRFTTIGKAPELLLEVDGASYRLTALETGFQHLPRFIWGWPSSPVDYLKQGSRYSNIAPPKLFKRSLRYQAFRSVEGFDKVSVDTSPTVQLKNLGESFTVRLLFETESEIGQLITKDKSYRVSFKSWNEPQLDEIKTSG